MLDGEPRQQDEYRDPVPRSSGGDLAWSNEPFDRDELQAAAVGGVGWTLLQKWGARVASLSSFVVLARLLSPTEFGLIALASLATGLGLVLVDWGFGTYLVQRTQLTRSVVETTLWTSVLMGLLLTAGQILMAGPISDLFNEPDLQPVIIVLAATYPIAAVYGVQAALLRRKLRFRSLAIRTLVASAVSAVVAVWLALAGLGVWSLVAQQVSFLTVSAIAVWVAAPWLPRVHWKASEFASATSFGLGVVGTSLVQFGSTSAHRLVLGSTSSSATVGSFDVAMRLVNLNVDLFLGSLTSVSTPVFARAKVDRALLTRSYLRGVRLGALVAGIGLGFLVATSQHLIPLVFGEQWRNVTTVAAVLSVAALVGSAVWLDRGLLFALGRSRLEFLLASGEFVTILIAFTIGSRYGLVGMAVALCLRNLAYWPIRLHVTSRLLDFSAAHLAVRLMTIWIAVLIPSLVMASLDVFDLPLSDPAMVLLQGSGFLVASLIILRLTSTSDFNYAWGILLGRLRSTRR